MYNSDKDLDYKKIFESFDKSRMEYIKSCYSAMGEATKRYDVLAPLDFPKSDRFDDAFVENALNGTTESEIMLGQSIAENIAKSLKKNRAIEAVDGKEYRVKTFVIAAFAVVSFVLAAFILLILPHIVFSSITGGSVVERLLNNVTVYHAAVIAALSAAVAGITYYVWRTTRHDGNATLRAAYKWGSALSIIPSFIYAITYSIVYVIL